MDLNFQIDVDAKAAHEQAALLANDVRVLVGQLNEAIRRASEQRLRVEVSACNTLDLRTAAGALPVISVRIFSEVQ